MAIDIVHLIKNPTIDNDGLETILQQILDDHETSQDVTCILTDDGHVHQLNRDYRNKDTTTDVLSFEMADQIHEASPLGEIYISIDKAIKQAKAADHPLNQEVVILAIHGTLHLLGYEHDTDPGYEHMRGKENQYLEKYNLQLKGA